jgi:hypothetical protein
MGKGVGGGGGGGGVVGREIWNHGVGVSGVVSRGLEELQ